MLKQKRIFWEQRSGSSLYNDGEYKVKLLNNDIVKVGDVVLVKFENGNFKGIVKQTAGFGNKEFRAIMLILFPGRKKGIKVDIDNVLNKI